MNSKVVNTNFLPGTTSESEKIRKWSEDQSDQTEEISGQEPPKSNGEISSMVIPISKEGRPQESRSWPNQIDEAADRQEAMLSAAQTIAERTQKLYEQQSSFNQRTVVQAHLENWPPILKESLDMSAKLDPERYRHHFIENKKKNPAALASQNGGLSFQASSSLEDQDNRDAVAGNAKKYLSALNTNRNPDLLVPGSKFLKGNFYFKEQVTEEAQKDQQEQQQDGEGSEQADEFDEEFEKMKNQQARYFIEGNITIRCNNCQGMGHRARECPNEKKKSNCILCGKEGHDSFSCTEKICFKCNKVGHMAKDCKEKICMKCNRCGLNGHKEKRCLKAWKGDYTQEVLNNYVRCVQCGKTGHFKCTSEKQSRDIKIDMQVYDDLTEFIDKSPEKKGQSEAAAQEVVERELRFSFDYVEESEVAEGPGSSKLGGANGSHWMKNNTNVLVPSKGHQLSPMQKAKQRYGIPRNHTPREFYCCYCGDKHKEEFCFTKKYGNQRFQQYERVRERLNGDDSWMDYRGGGNSSYADRIANDPRRVVMNANNGGRYQQSDTYQGKRSHRAYDDDDEDEGSRNRKSKKRQRKYEDSSESDSVPDYNMREDASESDSDDSGAVSLTDSYSDSSDDDSKSGSSYDSEENESDHELLSTFDQKLKAKGKQQKQQGGQHHQHHRQISHHHHHHKHTKGIQKHRQSRNNHHRSQGGNGKPQSNRGYKDSGNRGYKDSGNRGYSKPYKSQQQGGGGGYWKSNYNKGQGRNYNRY